MPGLHDVNARLFCECIQSSRQTRIALACVPEELREALLKFERDAVAGNIVVDLDLKKLDFFVLVRRKDVTGVVGPFVDASVALGTHFTRFGNPQTATKRT